MKHHNRVIKQILLLLAISLVLSGCSSDSGNDSSPKQIPETICFGHWDMDLMQNSKRSDGLTKYLEKKFGFTASAQSFNWSNYKQQYRVLAATEELPDVFTTVLLSSNDASDNAFFNKLVENQMIQRIPDDLSAYPNLQKLLQDFESLRHTDGHHYAIPHPLFDEAILSSSDAAMLVRRDWMNTLGLTDPQSSDDFIEITTAFAKQDPDGNGIDDTIGYNVNALSALGKWVILGIAPECNTYSWVKDTDGVYRPAWCTEDFKKVVTFYRKLYSSGGLDPEFYAKNSAAVLDDFCSGRLGALEYKATAASIQEVEKMWNEKNDRPFSDCVDVLPIFPAPDGKRYCNSSGSFWSETYINANVSKEQLDIILSLLDYLLSPEGIDLCRYGIEGTDYIKEKDGSIRSLLSETSNCQKAGLMEKYPSWMLWSYLGSYGWCRSDFENTEETYFLYGKPSVLLAEKALDFCENNTIQLERPYDFINTPKEDASFNSDAFDSFIQCILGTEDPLVMWDQALQNLYDQGLEEYILRQNP